MKINSIGAWLLFVGVVVALVVLYVQVYKDSRHNVYVVDAQYTTNQTLPLSKAGIVLLRGQTETQENGVYYEGLLGSPVYNWPDQVSVTVLDDNEQLYYRRTQLPQWSSISYPTSDVDKSYVDTQITETKSTTEAYTDTQIATKSEYYYISSYAENELAYVNYINLAGHPTGEYKIDFFDTSSTSSGNTILITEGTFGVTVTANNNFLVPVATKVKINVVGAGRSSCELMLHQSDTDTTDVTGGVEKVKFTDIGADVEAWTACFDAVIPTGKYFWVRVHLTPPSSEDDVFLFGYTLTAQPL